MDLQIMKAPVTSNIDMTRYVELYSHLISEFAELHNTTATFLKNKGRDTGLETRRPLREIDHTARELKRQGQLVSREHLENVRATVKANKQEAARLKALPKKIKKLLKGNNNDINNTN
jgi:hypothetical protein